MCCVCEYRHGLHFVHSVNTDRPGHCEHLFTRGLSASIFMYGHNPSRSTCVHLCMRVYVHVCMYMWLCACHIFFFFFFFNVTFPYLTAHTLPIGVLPLFWFVHTSPHVLCLLTIDLICLYESCFALPLSLSLISQPW